MLLPILCEEEQTMRAQAEDILTRLSDALATRVAATSALAVCIHATGSGPRSGTLWRSDVVVASESGVECFSTVASDSPTRALNLLAI